MIIEREVFASSHIEKSIYEPSRSLVVTDKARNTLTWAEIEIVEHFALGMHTVLGISSTRMVTKNTTASQLSKMYDDFNVSSLEGKGGGTEGQKSRLFLELVRNNFIGLHPCDTSNLPTELSLNAKAYSIFTEREVDVLDTIISGNTSNPLIAKKLVISRSTSKKHLERMYSKSGISIIGRKGIIGMLVTLIEDGVLDLNAADCDNSHHKF